MTAVVSEELWRERLTAELTWIFATIALGLAAIGVYAVVAYSVTRRTREIGIRLALGASHARVIRNVLRDAAWPIAIGIIVGLIGARAAVDVLAVDLRVENGQHLAVEVLDFIHEGRRAATSAAASGRVAVDARRHGSPVRETRRRGKGASALLS